MFLFVSCKQEENCDCNYEIIDCPAEIAERAFCFAEIYRDSETEYELGGQSPCRSIKIDCSGLIIMCYKYALVDTNYTLLVNDMTAGYMYENAATLTDSPTKGNLVFMGESNSKKITHIAILDKIENGIVYFIDSTKKENIDGVTERNYNVNDDRVKAYGVMKLKKW